jgi:nitrogen fixation NifU-like protein
MCGDRVTVFLRVEKGVVEDAAFQGAGCAISQASCSLMTEAVRGRPLVEVESLFETFHDLVTGKAVTEGETEGLGKLAAFSGVAEFPMRVKCATLGWHTLRAALAGAAAPVSTE